MTGLRVLLRKELREAWRTRRLPAVVVLFAVVGILSPLTARYLPEILKRGPRRPELPHPHPDADVGRCRPPASEEPRPARRVRRDHPRDGLGREREGARDGGVPPDEAADAAGRSSVRSSRRSASSSASRHSSPSRSAGSYTAILFEPRTAPRVGRAGRAHLARPVLLGGDHVPGLDRPRLGGRGGRHRRAGPRGRVARRGDPGRRSVPARSGSTRRRSPWRQARRPVWHRTSWRRRSSAAPSSSRAPVSRPGCRSGARSSDRGRHGRSRAGAGPQTTSSAREPGDRVAVVAELGQDLVGLLAEERRRRPDRGRRGDSLNGSPTWRIGPSRGCSTVDDHRREPVPVG